MWRWYGKVKQVAWTGVYWLILWRITDDFLHCDVGEWGKYAYAYANANVTVVLPQNNTAQALDGWMDGVAVLWESGDWYDTI